MGRSSDRKMSVRQQARGLLYGGGWLALVLVLFTLLVPRVSVASHTVIPPGREAHVHALLQPHALGGAITPGWTLHSFRIDVATIHLWVAGPGEAFAHVTLEHSDEGPAEARRLPSFALTVVARPPGSEAAIDELCQAIERNDDGSFWGASGVRVPSSSSGVDGIVLLIGFTVLVLVLVRRKLLGAPRWMKWSLLTLVLAGAALRVVLSPAVGMEAWPYTRYMLPAWLVLDGPVLALLLPDEVRALLDDPPQCLVYYEGLPCFGSKGPGEHKAAACRAIESLVPLEMIASTQFDSRVYDEGVGKGLGSIDRIELTLYRAYRKPPQDQSKRMMPSSTRP